MDFNNFSLRPRMEPVHVPVPRPRKYSQTIINYEVSLCEELKKALPLHGQCTPELIVGMSEILDIEDVMNITNDVLGNTAWSLVYSTSLNERSLQGLYDRLEHAKNPDTPVLLIIKDRAKEVFGALLPMNLHWSAVPYQIDQASLFRCRPEFSTFQGITEHKYIVRSTSEFLSIGDPEGKCGIWLNENLTLGKTEDYAFGKDKDKELSIVETRQFEVKALECWMFGTIQKRSQSVS